jgi:uncharacterized membrane protein YfcA
VSNSLPEVKMLTDAGSILIGLLAGIIGTIIGAGGGFLMVPYLLLAKHFTPQLAVGTSLAVVFFNALSGSYVYARQRRIDYPTAWRFALATLPGSILGAYAAQWFSGPALRSFFASFIILVAIYIFYRSLNTETAAANEQSSLHKKLDQQKTLTDAFGNSYIISYDLKWGILSSFFVGFLASILGIGGGVIHVPLMIYLLGFPPHLATATSHLILTISSFFAGTSHLYLGNVDLRMSAYLAIGAIIGAQVGARLAKKIKGPLIIRALSITLLFLGVRLLA